MEPSMLLGRLTVGQQPTRVELDRALMAVAVRPLDLAEPVVEEMLARLRQTHGNGAALFAAFEIAPEPALDWHARKDQLHLCDILPRLLAHPTIRAGLPDLLIPSEPSAPDDGFAPHHGLEADTQLALPLYWGGAYWRSSGSGMAEKALAHRFCDALFGLRFDEIGFYTSGRAWTDWFYDLAWDQTFVILDKRHRHLFVLTVTDTD